MEKHIAFADEYTDTWKDSVRNRNVRRLGPARRSATHTKYELILIIMHCRLTGGGTNINIWTLSQFYDGKTAPIRVKSSLHVCELRKRSK